MAGTNLLNGSNKATSMLQKLLASSQLASGDNTVYTVPASTATKIATASLCNTSASPVTISVSVVPSGGSVDGTHKVISGYSLASGDTISQEDGLSVLKGLMLDAGAVINVNASAATAVDVVLTGVVTS